MFATNAAERVAVGLPAYVDPRPAMMEDAEGPDFTRKARFVAKTLFDPSTGCLVWTGAKDSKWGLFHLHDRTTTALQASCRLFGTNKNPSRVMRVCDTPLCVHPEHLVGVTKFSPPKTSPQPPSGPNRSWWPQ